MHTFEKKYGLQEDEKTITFHQSRRMFCIYKNKLYIAEPHLPYSNAIWFEKQGWISKQNQKLMNEIVRGIIDDKGNVYFYVGFDFDVNEKTEIVFFSHLKELSEKLQLHPTAEIFGGLIKKKSGTLWLPKKAYGKIKETI